MNLGLTRHILGEMHLVSDNNVFYMIYVFLFKKYDELCYTIIKNRYHILITVYIYII